jgi:quercetin dioxygenase-like cupin family protein
MKIIKPSEVELINNKFGLIAKKVYSKEEAEIMYISLKEQQELPAHATPVDVIFYIIEGSGEITIGEETEKVEQGMLIESPKDIPHGLKNIGKGNYSFLVIKTPRP